MKEDVLCQMNASVTTVDLNIANIFFPFVHIVYFYFSEWSARR